VQSVTHVINQAQGAWTTASFAGAYVHDETIDFDQKGRSLEEVANRATDGFRDDRYDSTRIGKEVYQRLFGCDSLYEILGRAQSTGSGDLLSQKLGALKEAGWGNIPLSVEAVAGLYQQAVSTRSDVDLFTQSVSWRPKANLLEMMGSDLVERGTDSLAIDRVSIRKTDAELIANEGFFATCVDPEAYTTIHAEFNALATRTIPVTQTTEVPEISLPVGNQQSRLILRPAKTVTSTTYKTVTKNTKGNYELAKHLEARRSKILAYVDSLRLRGLRG
jgi:hypothetical protein